MYDEKTTAELEALLESYEKTIRELRSGGTSAMLDCREMHVCEHNASYIREELFRRTK